MFKITKKSKRSAARTGIIRTAHGVIKTPAFMPIATKGAVKTLAAEELRRLNPGVILSNTYHQLLRPGLAVLKKAGGLHKFMDWHGPLLTDSGGFQVFSLAKIRKILPHGVRFRSHIDGAEFLLTPKKALEIQAVVGSDIRMVLDVCAPYSCSRKEAERAVELTTKWAELSARHSERSEESRELHSQRHRRDPSPTAQDDALLFAIIQGSTHKDLRLKSARELVALGFDGYAIGGLAVGESAEDMLKVLEYTVPELPEQKPRYLMGVGLPEQIVEAVKRGIDMFDCVIPTREARHGRLYVEADLRGLVRGSARSALSSVRVNPRFVPRRSASISITNKKFSTDFTPINPSSKLPELQTYTKAYLHHLFRTQEPLAIRLATLNNVDFYLGLMCRIRLGIRNGIL